MGPNKDVSLVARALSFIQGDLRDIPLFHTDRGSEFKYQLIDETLAAFQIGRSLSMKGCPYDNFFSQIKFDSLEPLTLEFSDYVNWFNKL